MKESIGARGGAQPLFRRWETIEKRIRRARRVLLLLDFDGTLVGFSPKPQEVKLDAALRRLLNRLARHPRITLVFVSGRRRADVKRRAAVRGASYYGLHGWEARAGMRLKSGPRKQLEAAECQLAARIEGLPGVWLEDKQASFVMHYREAAGPAARKALAAAGSVARDFAPQLRALSGKKIWELLPAELPGKGATVKALANGHGPGALVIYAGDDTTDESAFAALRRGGVTIHVGRAGHAGRTAATRARYRVRDPQEMAIFLERLGDLIS
ncbi:MAG: trehalose-phosphatase [Terriglobia bacterium]